MRLALPASRNVGEEKSFGLGRENARWGKRAYSFWLTQPSPKLQASSSMGQSLTAPSATSRRTSYTSLYSNVIYAEMFA